MKKTLSGLIFILLAALTSYSYADFYVIPVVKEVEVCNGATAGIEEFTVSDDNGNYLYVGDLYQTSTGHLIIITGISGGSVGYRYSSYSFSLTPDILPEPEYDGIKGAFYYLSEGEVAYADFL